MDILALFSIFFPILPVVAVLYKQAWNKESLNFLMILCLLNFIRNIITVVAGINPVASGIVAQLFSLLEFVLLIKLFLPLTPPGLRFMVIVFFVAIVSSATTFFLLKGISHESTTLYVLQDALITLFALFALSVLILDGNLLILRLPLFWIATGTLFFFSIDALTRSLGADAKNDSNALLYVAKLFRYIFYLFAVLFYTQDDEPRGKNTSSF